MQTRYEPVTTVHTRWAFTTSGRCGSSPLIFAFLIRTAGTSFGFGLDGGVASGAAGVSARADPSRYATSKCPQRTPNRITIDTGMMGWIRRCMVCLYVNRPDVKAASSQQRFGVVTRARVLIPSSDLAAALG